MRPSDEPARLADDPGLDEWFVELLHGTGPYKSPPGRKQRVLLGLGRPIGGRALLFLRPAIVAGVLLACGAFATAAIGPWRGWVGRTYARLVPPATTPLAAPAPARGPARTAPLVLASAPQAIAPSPPAPPASPVSSASSASSATLAHREGGTPSRARRNAPAPVQAQAEEDPRMVLEGMRALRSEGNPVRARGLLTRYLERHPDGSLAEEALALSIEAAIAHRDADAAELGARYLRQYPAGRFTALARRAQK